MEVILGVVIGIVGILGIVFSRLITTFVHELGHTIAALAFTEGPVEMYVGSYGNESKSLKIRLGRLTLYLSLIIWNLEIGLCRHQSSDSHLKNLIIILSGPLLSLILGIFFFILLVQPQYSDGEKFVISIFMISSMWDFFVNMIPKKDSIKLYNGSEVQNDGRQFMEVLQERKLSDEYLKVKELNSSGKKKEALLILNRLLTDHPKIRAYHELRIDIMNDIGTPPELLEFFDIYLNEMDPTTKYVGLWADAKIKMHDYDEVVEKLTNIIYKGKGNYDLHFKRGRALVELGEYYDALRDFHALTLGKVEDPLALANRAYCQFRLGYEDEAKEDVLQAISGAKSPLGEIYYLAGVIFEPTDEDKALTYYKKAVSLKYIHHALAFNISRIEKFK